jgi:hypothetical protein
MREKIATWALAMNISRADKVFPGLDEHLKRP